METTEIKTEIKYEHLGTLDVGQIWASRRHGVFVVVSATPAKWRGEDRDVYAHIDTWYTIRPANEAETALYNDALAASAARKASRKQLNAESSLYRFEPASRRLVSDMRRLDSYDDRWSPPAAIQLDDAGMAIEQGYVDALAALKGRVQS